MGAGGVTETGYLRVLRERSIIVVSNTASQTMLNTDETFFLNHLMRWGSDGYGAFLAKQGRGWVTTGCAKAPVVFKTKREAVAQIERFHAVLLDRKAGRL